MTSRWMLGVQGRNRAFRKKQGNISMTDRERKFYRRKVTISKDGFIIKIESIDEHLERMLVEAEVERYHPNEPQRFLARLLECESVHDLPINKDEQKIIDTVRIRGGTVNEAEEGILRYRRLTDRKATEERQKAKALKAYKDRKKRKKAQKPATEFKTFTFPDK